MILMACVLANVLLAEYTDEMVQIQFLCVLTRQTLSAR